jgi:hypothetical protein
MLCICMYVWRLGRFERELVVSEEIWLGMSVYI